MGQDRRSRFTFGRVLLVVSALGILTGLLLPKYSDRFYPTPTIPTSPPDESYRVYLPSGWSIVRPPGWEVILNDAPDGSRGSFSFGIQMENSPHFLVEWSKEEPKQTAEGQDVSFQNRPARLASKYEAPSPSFFRGSDRREVYRIRNHGCLTATLIARRDDRWLSIRYVIYAACPVVPDVMWKFFETVRAPSDAAKPAA